MIKDVYRRSVCVQSHIRRQQVHLRTVACTFRFLLDRAARVGAVASLVLLRPTPSEKGVTCGRSLSVRHLLRGCLLHRLLHLRALFIPVGPWVASHGARCKNSQVVQSLVFCFYDTRVGASVLPIIGSGGTLHFFVLFFFGSCCHLDVCIFTWNAESGCWSWTGVNMLGITEPRAK